MNKFKDKYERVVLTTQNQCMYVETARGVMANRILTGMVIEYTSGGKRK